jgi:hypothetical protein
MVLRFVTVAVLKTVCGLVLLGILPVSAQGTDEPQQPECQSCTARHESLKRLQKKLSDQPAVIDAVPDASARVPPLFEASGSGHNDPKRPVTDE